MLEYMRYICNPVLSKPCVSIDNVTVIDLHLLVYNLTFKVKYRQNRTEILSLLAINFGIGEIFAKLNYPNLSTCIDNITAIDCNFLVFNFCIKNSNIENNRTEIPNLLAINFGYVIYLPFYNI